MYPYIILMRFSNFKVYFLATWWWLRLEPKSAAAGLQQRIRIPAEPEPCLERRPNLQSYLEDSDPPNTAGDFPGYNAYERLHWALLQESGKTLQWTPALNKEHKQKLPAAKVIAKLKAWGHRQGNHLLGDCPLSHLHSIYTLLCFAIGPPILYTIPCDSSEFF